MSPRAVGGSGVLVSRAVAEEVLQTGSLATADADFSLQQIDHAQDYTGSYL